MGLQSCFGECRNVLQWIGTKLWPNPKDDHLYFNICYKILEHCPKRKTRDQELKSKKGALLELDDSEDENGGRNKDKPEGNKKAQEMIGLRPKPQIWARRLRRW
jgi:hypothetical protein